MITGSYPPSRCGIASYTEKLVNQIVNLDVSIEISILTTAEQGISKKNSNSLINIFDIIKKWSLTEFLTVNNLIKKNNIIHIQYPSVNFMMGLLPWLLPLYIKIFFKNKRLIITYHGYFNVSLMHSLRALISLFCFTKAICVVPDHYEKIYWFFRKFINKNDYIYIKNVSNIPESKLSEVEICKIRSKFLKNKKNLAVYFGFTSSNKGVLDLFNIIDFENTHLIIISELNNNIPYHRKIADLIEHYQENITLTGYLDEISVADIIKSSDVAVFPFKSAGGDWNTSINSAILNNTYVVTTTDKKSWYDEINNVYYAKINDFNEMRIAVKNEKNINKQKTNFEKRGWVHLASDHIQLYKAIYHEKN